MGSNFHTPWDTSIGFDASDMNGIPADLDEAITYLKNLIVHYDGDVSYSKLTGVLTWDDTIRIVFTRADGNAIEKTSAAGTITLADNEFVYVDLEETDGTVLTMQKAAVTTGAASNFLAYNRLVLGYRNTDSDRFFSRYLDTDPDRLVQTEESDALVVVDWSLGSVCEVTLDRASTLFFFSGARDGQRLTLALTQDATGSRAVTFGAEVRAGTDVILPLSLSGAYLTDYVEFVYRDADGYYDLLSLIRGFGEYLS